jgi:hypothetical protein
MRLAHKPATILVVILALVIVPCGAMATDYYDPQVEAGAMAADALVVRPLGIVATVLGFGLFVVSVPFSALGSNTGDAWQALVVRPAKFTFTRPLGEFDGRARGHYMP